MAELNKYMNKAFEYEEKGYVEEAIQLCSKCMQAFPEYKNELELEIAKMNYRNGKEEQALIQFFSLYQKTGDSGILDLILEAYYGVRQQEFEERYQDNYKLLEKYPHYFGNREASEIRYYPILAGEEWIWYYDNVEKVFKDIKRCRLTMKKPHDAVCISSDLLWLEDILVLEELTRKVNPFMDAENALLLVYQKETWELLLQIMSLKGLLELDRIVFCEDRKQLEIAFMEAGVCLPSIATGNVSDEVSRIVNESNEKFEQENKQYQKEAAEYYEANSETVIRHIKEGKPKILFITSRFTTVLQYHIRDCRAAAEKMGLETELMIEKDRLLTGFNGTVQMRQISKFKPDIIFCIDHFRSERGYIPDEVVWITWIQDDLPHILNPETPLKFIERDFVMNHFITWNVIKNVGYPDSRTMDAPIVANGNLYKPYELTEEEKERYGADICMVCHAADAEEYMSDILDRFQGSSFKMVIENLLNDYSRLVMGEGVILYKKEDIAEFIKEYFKEFYSRECPRQLLSFMTEEMMRFSQRIFRQALADWLIEAGYENLKLWGNGWKESPKYKKYAMGAAENGEVLSKILQSTKIVLGNNFNVTGAARAWESMLSGTFYMSNYVPPEADATDIRTVLKEGENFVMFYDKPDLLCKVEYYLTHEDERKQMAMKGRQAALETMTYDSFMKKMLAYIKNYFDAKNIE